MTSRLIQDAARIAREIHAGNPELTQRGHLVPVRPHLLKIAEAEAARRLGVSVGAYAVKVFKTGVPSEGVLHSTVSLYERHRSPHAVILLASNNNRCWDRFAVAKELMHVFTGLAGDRKDVGTQVTLARDSRHNSPDAKTPMDDEMFCLHLAIEVMLPWSWRMELADLHDVHRQTNFQVASRLLVPQAIVEYFFDLGYAGMSHAANRGIA